MPLQFDTVAIPVTSGVNLNTPARLLQPVELLEATNSRFPRGGGAQKRRGHLATRIREAFHTIPPGVTSPVVTPPAYTAPFTNRTFPSNWLWGWGPLDAALSTGMSDALQTSLHPTVGLLFGSAQRDNEAVFWDGFRLMSRAPGQARGANLPTVDAVMPALRAFSVAKNNQAQQRGEAADTGKIKVVAWISADDVWYMVLDSASLAVLQPATALGMDSVDTMRVVNVGQWVHILAHESDDTLQRFSIHASDPRSVVNASLGACLQWFDLWKMNEVEWVVLRNEDGTTLSMTWHNADGTANNHNRTAVDVPISPANQVWACGVSVHPDTEMIGVAFRGHRPAVPDVSPEIWAVFGTSVEPGGVVSVTPIVLQEIDVTDVARPVTVAPNSVSDNDAAAFNAYYDYLGVAGDGGLQISRWSSSEIYEQKRLHLLLASSAFRCGNRTFVWGSYQSTYQSSWFLLDEKLLPIGRTEYITANVITDENRVATSVNWRADNGQPTVFHGAWGYRVRVQTDPPNIGANPPIQYADPSIKFYDLDMIPPLRSAQAGRSLYFAGAQVWSYDGLEMTEAGFHIAPEGVTANAAGSGSGLLAGDYTYRVDLCYRNAHNEEHRSASFYTTPETTTSGQEITLDIPTCLTRRTGSYFLIYRNAVNGTQWYLVNSRDPSSADFLVNDLSVATVQYVDDGAVSDTELPAQEFHPANGGFGYIDTFTAPACEVIAAGHDRLWVAGGEIPPGQVHPSRLYIPSETPGFNATLAIQVDRNAEPITALGFVGETRAYFRKTQTYVHQGEGPDNSSRGSWETPRLAYSDVGAISPASLGLISAGLLFQSPAGIRLLGAGGGLTPVGQPVDRYAKTLAITATLVAGDDQEVRFYHQTGALVFNYQYGTWSVWTCGAVGATRDSTTGLAILANPAGFIWEESDDLWLDNGHPYKHRIRFAWLRRGDIMDFQRVRRIGAVGEVDPTLQHSIHVDVYYDEREFAEEWFDWSYPDPGSQNTDVFGDNNFGDGAFGDTDGS